MAEGHVFAYAGLISAYTEPEGEEWLRQALDYIQKNIRYLDAELRSRMPRSRPFFRTPPIWCSWTAGN